MIEIRKTITLRETVFSELGVEASRPITRAVGMAVIRNPFAGQFVEDLRPLFEAGAMLGERLMPELVKLLDGPAVSYGKGAVVGVAGEWSTAARASIQCSGNRCGGRLVVERR
jgi:Amino acid synthesis